MSDHSSFPVFGVTFRGIIECGHSRHVNDGMNDTIYLRDEDGYKRDLLARFAESVFNYGEKCSVRYYIGGDHAEPLESIQEGFLRHLYGDVAIDQTVEHYSYSEWTSGTDYETILSVGGHSLWNELRDAEGRFLHLIVEFEK